MEYLLIARTPLEFVFHYDGLVLLTYYTVTLFGRRQQR